ncbi:MAG: HDOD domain-containing protein [Lautropia sp.]
MNQILFVDSDPAALDALKSALDSQSSDWNATYVASSQAALNLLANRWFDVIFTGLDLPGQDGIELLEQVRLHHPSIIRVLLAEPLDDARIDRALTVAQRFVAKPWDMPTLVANIESVLGAWPRTDNPLVRAVVGRLASLPSTNTTYPRLTAVMARQDSTIDEISAVVSTDPGLSAKLLQVVNSAFFGLPFKVASVPQAVSYLGLTSLRALVLLTTVFAAAEECPTVKGFSAPRLQRHSLLCARLARALVADRSQRDDAFTGGLLHDIGMLALAVGMNKRYALALRHAERSGRPLAEVEVSFLGTSHVAVGAYLADVWGLPGNVVDAIERHHEGEAGGHARPDLIAAVQLAQLAAECIEKGDPGFEGVGLTEEQIEQIEEEFALNELMPKSREPLLAI